MKNKEKYAKEIVELAIEGTPLGFHKDLNKITPCYDIPCQNCLFNGPRLCIITRREWANAEYIKPKQFTEREKAFVKLFPEIKYIARDKWGKLFAYKDKPEKYEDREEWFNCDDPDSFYEIHFWELKFNSIQWEDEEPTHRSEILGDKE